MCGSFPGLLIGRTAVHSGKDPAFVAYDQFLSTGILQPLSRGEVRGSFASILPCPLSCPLSPLPDSCSAADRSYSITSSARASSVGGTESRAPGRGLQFAADSKRPLSVIFLTNIRPPGSPAEITSPITSKAQTGA